MSTTFDRGTDDAEAPMYCAKHPNEQTYLRCGKCDKPICARCRVSTPVGFRCYECANLQSVPTYAVDTSFYLKSAMWGLAAAAVMGALMGLFPAFEFWAALIMGIVVPEAVSAAANQKRGPGLQMVAMGAIVFGFALSRIVMSAFPYLLPLGGINLPYPSGISLLRSVPFYVSQYTVLWLALALFLANRRLK